MKLTSRRRELLYHLMCTNDIEYRLEPMWTLGRPSRVQAVPYLGGINIQKTLNKLRELRLCRFVAVKRMFKPYEQEFVIYRITDKGVDVLLANVGGLDDVA